MSTVSEEVTEIVLNNTADAYLFIYLFFRSFSSFGWITDVSPFDEMMKFGFLET